MAREIITGEATVELTRDQVSSDLQGERVILNFRSGMYYGLDAVGSRVWQLLEAPRTVREIRDALLEEYEVEADRCEHDLLELLGQMAAQGLIEVRSEAVA